MLQEPLFTPPSEWEPPSLEELPDWSLAQRVGVDIETCDPGLANRIGPGTRHGGFICGVSFSIEDGSTFYLPTRHLGGDNLPEDKVLEYLRDQGQKFRGTLVGTNLNYDLDYLEEVGITFPKLKCQRDVQIADPLIDELQLSYSLENIAKRHSLPGKDETVLRQACADYGIKKPKQDMWKLPARYVGAYGEWDAELPLKLLRKQERLIEEQDLWQIYDLESKVQPVLLKMRRRGVKIDLDKLGCIERWSIAEETHALADVKRLTGVSIPVGEVWKAEIMAQPLLKEGYQVGKDSKGRLSVDQELLGRCGDVGKLLMRARKVNKLRTTFAQSIRNHLIGDRIHCTFNQMRREKEDGGEGGARYGRLSSEHPNLQQQPARDEFAKMWRSIYIPDEPGQMWMCNDYSQQEPRWLTHYAEILKLPGAHAAAEKYRNDPKTDNHKMMTEIVHPGILETDKRFKVERTACKQIYLGLCYGMGGAKLAKKLGLPTRWAVYGKHMQSTRYFEVSQEAIEFARENGGRAFETAGVEAQEKLDRFNANAAYVKGMARKCEEIAKKRGFIVTALGRHCRFPAKVDGSYDWTHKALNRLIQGSSADQTKKAMVDVDAAGYYLQLQVHDELDGSINNREEAEGIAEIMRTCVQMNVPSNVDIELGPNWGEAV